MLFSHPALRLGSHVLLFFVVALASSEALSFDVFWTGGNGAWTTGSNWDVLDEPDAMFEDVAVINNGGTATLNTTAIGTAGMALGYVADGSGTVIVQDGGSLTLVETEGAAQDIAPNGAANIGFEGGSGDEGDMGLLNVQGGGSLTAVYFDINQNGTLLIGGGPGSNPATVATSTGSLFSNGAVEVIGPGHSILLAGNVAFEEKAEGDSRLIPRITHATDHSVITAVGSATLAGTVAPIFDGVTPAVGDSWDLIDAASVAGQFEVDLSSAPQPVAGTTFVTRVVAGGNGSIVQLALENRASITVNGDTGAISMASLSGAPVNLVGYSILSDSGQLNDDNWTSLTSQGKAGWEEAGGTANYLNELNAEDSLMLGATPEQLGASVFQAPAEFGVEPDLTFRYAEDGELASSEGIIYYEGHKWANNLLLTIDPSTGEGQLKNSSHFAIDILGYTITSEEGSLDDMNWDSLESQSVPGWEEAASDAFSLSELVPEDPASSLTPGQSYPLGDMFTVGGLRDLEMEFAIVLDGVAQVLQGTVHYGDISVLVGLPGDFNDDNVVDAADYTVWRDNLGLSDAALNGNGTGDASGLVVQEDYSLWRDNYGSAGAGAGALVADATTAPEPTALATVLAAVLAMCGFRARRMSVCRVE